MALTVLWFFTFTAQYMESVPGMKESGDKNWLWALILLGLSYMAIGVVFGKLGWRMAAWLVSALLFAVHTAYGHFRLRSAPRHTALQVSAAAALGAFGLAVAANIHELSVNPDHHRPLLLLSLVLWPLITVAPAFAVALAVAVGLARWRSRISDNNTESTE